MRVLITGTTGGIGSAVKAEAVLRGHEVVELNRNDFVTKFELGSQAFSGFVFCTGMCPVKPLAQTTDELFDETLRVNCTLFLAVMRELVTKKLFNSEGFKAIAVSSVSATEGWPGGAAYCASKGALSALCRALEAELNSKHISITALEPRYVKTKMFYACAGRMGVPASQALEPADFAREILDRLEGKIS